MDNLKLNDMQQHWEHFLSSAISSAPQVVTAIVSALLIYLLGTWIIKLINRVADKTFKKRQMERSEEHTSELQSRENLVCRLLLEKKKQKQTHVVSPIQ